MHVYVIKIIYPFFCHYLGPDHNDQRLAGQKSSDLSFTSHLNSFKEKNEIYCQLVDLITTVNPGKLLRRKGDLKYLISYALSADEHCDLVAASNLTSSIVQGITVFLLNI